MKTVTIILKPYIESQNEECIEDFNLLFQQGYNTSTIEIEAGETFEILDKFEEGLIDCEGELLFFKHKDDDFEEEYESDETIVLSPGKYKFLEDGFTFIKI